MRIVWSFIDLTEDSGAARGSMNAGLFLEGV